MKKTLLAALAPVFLTISCAWIPQASNQTWSSLYTADALPTAASATLAEPFVLGDKMPASVTENATVRYGLADDPNAKGNKVFWFSTSKAAEKGSLKINLTKPQPTDATVLFRSKIGDQPCGIDFELNSPTSRARVRLLNDPVKGAQLLIDDPVPANKNSASVALDVTRWHTFRLTMSRGNTFNVYVDENPTPVIANFVTSSTKHTHFIRIADASDDFVTAGSLDWMAWDMTGAYAPGGNLPAGVIVDKVGK